MREEWSLIYPSCLHRTPGPSAHFQLSTPIPCMLYVKPLENLFLPKFNLAKIAPRVGQLLEKSGLRTGSLSKNDNVLSRNSNIFSLSSVGFFGPNGRNTSEILPLPHLPHCHSLFPLHFSLNLPETQVPHLNRRFCIFHSAGIWLCEPPEDFQGNLSISCVTRNQQLKDK